MAKGKKLKVVTEKELASILLAVVQGQVSKMQKDDGCIGLRTIVKASPTSDGSGRYSLLIDAGSVYKYLVDPNL